VLKYEEFEIKVNNVTETKEVAMKLAKYLRPGDVIALNGDLGAGKTSFTQGIAKGLGINQVVNSPTFTLIKEYEGKYPLYHMDVYRLEDQVEDIGFEDYFYDDGITVIEWASMIQDFLPVEYLNVHIHVLGLNERQFVFEPHGERYIQLCKEFKQNEDIGD